ncbi:copper resistance CopC family protein [Gottfriedia acidiceleris]|uniref:Copper resistance protein CopC n=1 Tax=Gottfriedia acidiceleris TaxID=371036 RepID=A0ABY4JPC7_9BACI|nr:copper resistance CopC family protein [Gottfriedia acidiceleris]UPM54542.1 copper resistance protein CopC [Gottfriedia acidiceleris]
MKKGLSIIILLLFLFPTMASAHTKLVSSNPSNGQIITEPTKQITLEFEEALEQLGTIKLDKAGSATAVTNVSIKGNKLIANLPNGLENGDYKIEWKVVSEDGHPITGQIPFKVQLKQVETKTTTETKTTAKAVKDQMPAKEKQIEATPKKERSKYLIPLIAIGLFGIVLMVGGVVLWNRK